MTDDWKDRLRTGAGLDALRGSLAQASADNFIGRALGDYRIEQPLAEGGMGKVFLAKRTDGSFDRDVAIKISPVSLLSDELRNRALQEQAVLAGLNHPNICQLYDAGVTEEGWPYLVMEYIDGTPIDEYVRTRNYSTREIIELFLAIVDAVVYAHSRLIVHRDIKPSNTLVSGAGLPKLLDFGIAKLIESDDQGLTRDSRPLSPRFASPEQLLGQTITTASDVYQLGALLGELLVGRPVLQDETLEDAITRAAQSRPVDLSGDDWNRVPAELRRIVEQCIVPDPGERYASATMLKDDLTAHLNGFPVRAVGQGAGYRLRKFAGRNRAALSAAALTIAGIVALTAWYTHNLAAARDRAETEANNARQVSDFLIGMFAAANPNVSGRADATVREVLDEQARKIESDLGGQPETQARLMVTAAQAYQKLGRFEDGLQWANRAVALTESSPQLAEAYRFDAQGTQISLLFDLARYDELVGVIDDHLADTVAVYGADTEQALMARNRLASLHGFRGELDQALPLFRDLYSDCAVTLGPTHTLTLKLAGNLAAFLQYAGELDESLAVTREAYLAASGVLPGSNEQLLILLYNMASTYNVLGDHENALEHFSTYRDRVAETYGSDSYQVMLARRGLGVVHSNLGNYEEAVRIQSALARQEAEILGADHPETLSTQQNLANTLTQLGQIDEALRILDEILPKQAQALGPDHYLTLTSRVARADALFASEDPGARDYFEATREAVTKALGGDHFLVDSLQEIEAAYPQQFR